MIELNVTQGSPEWHAARAKCFNASEAPAMQGVSPYKTRSALLAEKATGIVPEVDAATQARFDMGHEVEAMARPLIEEIIGEELYPIVATDDTGKYLASSDGATMLCNIGFEHKALNKEIAAMVDEGNVPESHRGQLDHQFLVFGFEKIIFVCSDGTRENLHYCWYYPQKERIDALCAGWEQFEKDLANYQHAESKPAAVAEVIDDLPALTVQLVGQVTASNLATFQTVVLERIKAINTTLVTDSDFATADKMVKFLDDGEKRLDLVKSQALAQTESIDQLFRTIDSLKAEMRGKRLTLDKLVKAEKESRKAEIVREGQLAFGEHMQCIADRLRIDGVMKHFAMPQLGEAIKGMKSLDSMRDKISVALANAKIEANAIADRIQHNREQLRPQDGTVGDDWISLFHDFASVCTKSADDFHNLVTARVAARKEAEEKRLAAERERIRQEEISRINAEQAAAAAKAQREADARAAEQVAAAKAITEANRNQFEQPAVVKESLTTAQPSVVSSAIDPANDDGPMLKLGEINALLGFTVSADFMEQLGVKAKTEKNAKLYPASKFPTICRLLSDHVLALSFKKAA